MPCLKLTDDIDSRTYTGDYKNYQNISFRVLFSCENVWDIVL